MAPKFCHPLLVSFLMSLVLQPFVAQSRPANMDQSLKNHSLVADWTYFNGNKWNSPHLSYGFPSNYHLPNGVDFQALRNVMSQAFTTWAAAVPQFEFREVASASQADITIVFDTIDGYGTVWAFSYAPPKGRLQFDIDEKWSTDYPASDQTDLQSVALHEIGHLLGLGHSQFQNAVMYRSLAFGVTKRTLTQDDVNGLKSLYGY